MAYVTGGAADTPAEENVRRFGVATAGEAVRQLALGGVIYFGWADNVAEPRSVAALSNGLQRASTVPLTVAIDEEPGAVSRLGSAITQLPGAAALGATGDPQLTAEAYQLVGSELRSMGINTDYAPVADVQLDPANPIIGVRAFGSDPARVAEHVAAAVSGLQSAGVSATAKHFPGHGDTAVDSHVGLPLVGHSLRQWEELDAPPFRAAIGAGCDAVMTGHLSYPEHDASGDPASLSHPITTGLLRERLGFDGVVVTDSLRMAGVSERYPEAEVAVRALEAGADVLLDPEHPRVVRDAVLQAVRTGRLSEDRIDRSVQRVLAVKRRRQQPSPLVDEAAVAALVGSPEHLARARRITAATEAHCRRPRGG